MNKDELWNNEDVIQTKTSEERLDARITHWPRLRDLNAEELDLSCVKKTNTRMVIQRYSVQELANEQLLTKHQQHNMQANLQKIETDAVKSKAATLNLQTNPLPPFPKTSRMVNLETLRALECESPRSQGKFQREGGLEEIKGMTTTFYDTSRNLSQMTHIDSGHEGSSHFPQIYKDQSMPIGIPLSFTKKVSKGSSSSRTPPSDVTATSQRHGRQGNHKRNQSILQTPIMINKTTDKSFWSPSSDGSTTPDKTYFSKPSCNYDTRYLANEMHSTSLSLSKEECVKRDFFLASSIDTPVQREELPPNPASLLTVPGLRMPVDGEHATFKKTKEIISHPVVFGRSHLRVNTTATHRLSQGWWNVITTPFLSPVNSHTDQEREFPLCHSNDGLESAMTRANSINRKRTKTWEKKLFPSSPIAHSSDPWWYLNSSASRPPSIQESRKKVQTSSAEIISFIHSEATVGFESESTTSLVNEQEFNKTKQQNLYKTRNSDFNQNRIRKIDTSKVTDEPKKPSQYSMLKFYDAIRQSIDKRLRSGVFNLKSSDQIMLDESQTNLVPAWKHKVTMPTDDRFWPSVSKGSTSKVPNDKLQQSEVVFERQNPISNILPARPPHIKLQHNLRNPASPVQKKSFQCFQVVDGKNKMKQRAKKRNTKYRNRGNITFQESTCWQIRGFFSKSSSYIKTKGKIKRKQDWLMMIALLIFLITILAVLLAKKLHQVPRATGLHDQPSWSNITNFPSIPLGYSTIISPIVIKETSACVVPSTKWSCHLPKELQQSTTSSGPSNRPNFFFRIELKNNNLTDSRLSNMGVGTSTISFSTWKRMRYMFVKAKQFKILVPEPTPPSFDEELFLGRTTDGIISDKKAGEPSPFYISFIQSSKETTTKRKIPCEVPSNYTFPNVSSLIPAPSLNYDGTAAPVNLLPFPSYQPVRFYDRGLPSEHYGFYSYFDRSIFLGTIDINNSTIADNRAIPDDSNGGATEDEALFRCTWSQTRFLVQIWTQKKNFSSIGDTKLQTTNSSLTADIKQPRFFPYPTTITLDRHGGNSSTKMLYCYEMNNRKELIPSTGQISAEDRGYGGVIVNPAPTAFNNISNPNLGGFDGGTSGCNCQWANFQKT